MGTEVIGADPVVLVETRSCQCRAGLRSAAPLSSPPIRSPVVSVPHVQNAQDLSWALQPRVPEESALRRAKLPHRNASPRQSTALLRECAPSPLSSVCTVIWVAEMDESIVLTGTCSARARRTGLLLQAVLDGQIETA